MATVFTHLSQAAGGGSIRNRPCRQPCGFAVHWILRVGVAMEYIGHGACGLHTKAAWLPYFGLFGIEPGVAWKLMPVVGSLDVLLGISVLIAPRRAVLLYMALWGFFTALLRPATGEGIWEFLERSYNFGVPLTLFLLHDHGRSTGRWFERLRTPVLDRERAYQLAWALRAVVALMLIGHGGLGVFSAKKNLLHFYQAAGFGGFGVSLESVRMIIGLGEFILGTAALAVSGSGFFVFLFVWKFGSELLYPISGANLACWEVIERGASYVAPLAFICLWQFSTKNERPAREVPRGPGEDSPLMGLF